uniref:uncharacterized protein LOC120335866 n=1 Tax=Styela clava TaxID=7725 RepID=UPI00193A5873|nr:uncharacterized protein LOC120335866 [Styela clava]
MAEKITKYFEVKFSNSSKEKKTFDDSSQPISDTKEESQTSNIKDLSLEECMRLGQDNTAMFIIEKAVQNKWPWLEVGISNNGAVILQITCQSEKEDDFNKLLTEKKIENYLKDIFEDLESDLLGIIGDKQFVIHESKILELLSGMIVESFDSIRSCFKVSNQLEKNMKVEFKILKPGQSDVITSTADVDLVKDAINLLGPEGKESFHIDKCLKNDSFDTIRIALFVVASSLMKKWPWMKISGIKKRNILQISVESKYDVMFSHLMDKNKIENHVREDFECMNANLMGIIGSPIYLKTGEVICQLLEGVHLKSLKSNRHRPSIDNHSSACIRLSIEESGESESPGEQLVLTTETKFVAEIATSDIEAEPIAMENVLGSGNQAALAISLASRSLTREWPWIQTTDVIEGNRLCLSVPEGRGRELHMLINEGQIRDRINHDFEHLEDELTHILQEGILGEFRSEIVRRMKNVNVTKIDKVNIPDVCGTANKYIDGGEAGGIHTIISKNTVNLAKSGDSQRDITANVIAKGSGVTNIHEDNVINIAGNVNARDLEVVGKLLANLKK